MKVTEEEVKGRWIELKDRAVFRLTGPDRVRYLNGQVTNDVSKPLREVALPACVCSRKGKVEFLVWITEQEDSLLIDGQLDQREELFERLDRYLIADDCELLDETGAHRLVHHFHEIKTGITSRRLSIQGQDLWLEPGAEVPFDSKDEVETEEWELLKIRSLVPEAPWEITGSELPAELRLDEWAVDFHKGCYLGQEVVSRIESVGKVKRKLSLISAEIPFRQNSALRNSSGTEIQSTRDAKENSKGDFLSLALLSTQGNQVHSDDFQRVVRY
ncbi:MAG: hypothetical protein P1U87_06505 [Verrucomicrobiales bacterium]|nr:hypothetical protein [Verrucomicrobiales bacterium]